MNRDRRNGIRAGIALAFWSLLIAGAILAERLS